MLKGRFHLIEGTNVDTILYIHYPQGFHLIAVVSVYIYIYRSQPLQNGTILPPKWKNQNWHMQLSVAKLLVA